MAHQPLFDPPPSTYPSPTVSPALTLPSLSGSYLLDSDGPTPSTSKLESTTGFEPLISSSPPQENSLKLAIAPGLDDTVGQEGQERCEREQDSTSGTTAAMGMLYCGEPEQGSASPTDEVEEEDRDPYEVAFMELRILRLSSRRLLNAVLRLSGSERLGRRTRSADLDDQMAKRIFDVHANLQATTNAMSRLYVITSYKSSRFRRVESFGRTRDCGSRTGVTGGLGNTGTPSEANSSRGEGAELWEWDTPTLNANSSADTLAGSAPPKAVVKDDEAPLNGLNGDLWFRRTARYQWRVFSGDLGGLGDNPLQDLLTMVILFVIMEVVTQTVGAIYRVWSTYALWGPKGPKYQCWEAV